MTTSTLPNPTPQGLEIIKAWEETTSSIMVNALAGTGKTTFLQQLAPKITQNQVLMLAFNKKNAEDLKSKLPIRFDCATMNSIGHRALATSLGRLNVQGEKNSKILKDLAPRFGYQKIEGDDFTSIMGLVSAAKSSGLMPSHFPQFKTMLADDWCSWEMLCDSKMIEFNQEMVDFARAILITSVQLTLKEKLIDYDDQIYMSTLAIGAYKRYEVVGVDEAQDLSPLNHLQLRKSLMANGRFLVVGDPRQAIYAFRGASSKSMAEIKELQPGRFVEFPLSLTFRCPKLVVARNVAHAPGFEAAPGNKEGSLITLTSKDSWSLDDLPGAGRGKIAFLCRNNAPLLSAAFRMLRNGVGVTMLGRDIGKSLTSLLRKIVGTKEYTLDGTFKKVQAWEGKQKELARLNGKESQIDVIEDRAGCLYAVIEGLLDDVGDETSNLTNRDVEKAITDLFADQSSLIVLGTAHRAKGMEWPVVIHLDPWRLPSKQAKRAEENGNPVPMEQEKNLRYVLETRSQDVLVLANLEQFQP